MKKTGIFLFAVLFVLAGASVSSALDEAKICASDAQGSDNFAWSVAISGDYVIAGAKNEDAGGSNAGAAYIFNRTGENVWDSGAKIMASDAAAGALFGSSVAISGEYAIVGAPSATGGAVLDGAAYIFRRTGVDSWDAGTKIIAADADDYDGFGSSVAIQGDYAVVGSRYEDAGGSNAGAAYIFHRTGTNAWDAGVKIVASDIADNDGFGASVSIYGDYAIVGALNHATSGAIAGAAYIFFRTGENTWDTGTEIIASDYQASDYFGCSVSIYGDYAVVGAYGEDQVASSAGAAYIFHRTAETTWDAGTKIVAADGEASDYFGYSVSISGPYVAVGAYGEDTDGSASGAAYLFSRTGETTWDTGTTLKASDVDLNDNYGWSVGIYGYYAVIGAPLENANSVSDAGSAYLIKHDLPTAVDLLAFAAEWVDAGAVLSWMTGSETACGAFTLLRCELDELWSSAEPYCAFDDYRELDIVVPCEDSLFGAEYEIVDLTADPAANYSYILREYETTGGVNDFGPISLVAVKYGDDLPGGSDGIPGDDDDGGASGDDDANETAAESETTDQDDDAGCGF